MSQMGEELEVVTPIKECHYDDVIAHLRNNFFADEPLNYSVQLCQVGQQHNDLEKHSLLTLKDNLSTMIVNATTKQVVGVALNGILLPTDEQSDEEKLSVVEDEKFKSIFNLLYGMNRNLDLFEKFNVDQIFECRILSVDHAYRGKGLAKQLLQRSVEIAITAGFKVIKSDATSFFTQKIAEKLGFETVHELYYAYYKGEDGQPLFTPPSPHDCLKVMVKVLY